MRIQVRKKISKIAAEFSHKEWKIQNREHFGKQVNWRHETFALEAKDKEAILGVAKGEIIAGVLYLETIIVSKDARGKGVGTGLMRETEKLARKKNCHKIYLYTGKGWKAEKFYMSLGYTKSAELPHHYLNKTWIEYTKFL